MSIGERISQLFGSTPAAPASAQPQPAVQQTQPQPGNFPDAATPAMATDPNNPIAPAVQPAKPEGLDQFNDLWKPPVESPDTTQQAGMFNVDPQKLMSAAKQIDFSKAITADQLGAISRGGQDAVTAFAQALNTVAQTVYAQSAHASTKIVEQAIKQSQESMRAELPSHIKRQTVSDNLRAENPAFSHPAAAPILGALQQQLTVKFPSATSSEISRMAQDYLTSFAGALNPKQQQSAAQQPQTDAGMDWDKYLN